MGALPDQEPEEADMPYVSRELREQAGEAPPGAVPGMGAEDVAAVEAVLGYEFLDKALLEEALTHGSFYFPYRPGATYERLEFLGDQVLGLVMTRDLYVVYPLLPPGPLTRLRAANVDKEKLARAAVVHGLHFFLRHKAPLLHTQIHDFMEDMDKYPIHSNGLLDPPKVLSDIVESLLGAIYVDSRFNLEEAWRVFRNLADPLISLKTLGKHPVSELFELCQKTRRRLKIMKDEWAKNLTVEVLVDGELVGSSTYAQKKEIAQNRAAKAALDRLKETLGHSGSDSMLAETSQLCDDLKL